MKVFIILAMIALAIYVFWNAIKDIEIARDAFSAQNTRKGMQTVGEILLSLVVLGAGICMVAFMW